MKNTVSGRTERELVLSALEAMKAEAGTDFSLATVNLAELGRRTGISRSRLRRLKRNGFEFRPHANAGRKSGKTSSIGFHIKR